jgi:hypothetical protein
VLFLYKKFRNEQCDPKFGCREGLVIPMPGKNVPGRRSCLHPSEKEFPELRSATKNTPPFTYLYFSELFKAKAANYILY